MQGVFQERQAADVENPKDLFQIFHCNVLEITRQVAGISLAPSPSVEISNAAVLYLSAFGGYQMELYLYTDKETMMRIAHNMKREPAAKSETLLYAAEFSIFWEDILSLGSIGPMAEPRVLNRRFVWMNGVYAAAAEVNVQCRCLTVGREEM